jgi:CBS-domain-containing membrane protein
MKAADVMVTDVITVRPDTSTQEAARILVDNGISAAPVVDEEGRVAGIVSEGDLIRRAEIGTEFRRSWWLELLSSPEARARDFVKSHALKVADVMTTRVVTAPEAASLGEIANLLEKNGIKRVPIVRDGRLVGIVSRANLLRAYATSAGRTTPDDDRLRERIVADIRALPWGMPWLLTVTVQDGVVDLWGPVNSEDQRQAIRVAAEATPGVKSVRDNLYYYPRAIA